MKKGFTLVELLAIIVIVAILSSVAIFSANSILNNSRENVIKLYEKKLKAEASNYYIDHLDEIPNVGSINFISLSNLIEDNYASKFEDKSLKLNYEESYISVIRKTTINNNYDLEYFVCLIQTDLNNNIIYQSSECEMESSDDNPLAISRFKKGEEFNNKIKQLALNLDSRNSLSVNYNIKKIKINNYVPDDIEFTDDNIVSDLNTTPIYAYIDNDTLNLYSQMPILYLNSDASKMFYNFYQLESIEGLRMIDTSLTTDMNDLFYFCQNISSLDLSNFNTKKVRNMSYMFYNCSELKILNLCNFNTSAVEKMTYMFSGTTKLTKVEVGLEWKINSLTSIEGMFENSGVSDVLKNSC